MFSRFRVPVTMSRGSAGFHEREDTYPTPYTLLPWATTLVLLKGQPILVVPSRIWVAHLCMAESSRKVPSSLVIG
jgi:hypothetical protein